MATVGVQDFGGPGRPDAQDDLNAVEYSAYLQAIENSRFRAILNEKIPPVSPDRDLPPSQRFNLISEETRRERGHPDVRIARRQRQSPGWRQSPTSAGKYQTACAVCWSFRQSVWRTWRPCVLHMSREGPRQTRLRSILRASSVLFSTSTAILALARLVLTGQHREGNERSTASRKQRERKMTPQEIADLFLQDIAAWYENAREPNGRSTGMSWQSAW